MSPNNPTVQSIPLEALVESPTNPRTIFADLSELARSVEAEGILQPLLVRPNGKPDQFEIVYGHRRYRAAKLALLETAPALVRELTDRQVLEIQMAENVARDDLHPADEAEAFMRWHRDHKIDVAEIADKCGKSIAYVYARMKLAEASDAVRKALADDKITASIALELARIPTEKLQAEALKQILDGRNWVRDDLEGKGKPEPVPMSFREAKALLRNRFMLRLEQAPFDTSDGELVPNVVACIDCPKRTGNQRELFADVKSADVCTDPTCFASKKRASSDKLLAAHKAKGLRVLTKAEAKKVYPYEHSSSPYYNSGFVDLSGRPGYGDLDHSASTARGWKSLLGKDAKPEIVLAIDAAGDVHELIEQKVARKLLKARHPDLAPKAKAKPASSANDKAKADRAKVKREQLERARWAALGDVIAAAEQLADTDTFRIIALGLLNNWDYLGEICKRRGIEVPKGQRLEQVLEAELSQMKLEQVVGLVLELVLVDEVGRHWFAKGERSLLELACRLYKVDLEAHKKAIAAADRAKAAEARKAKRAKAKASKKKRATKKATAKKTARKAAK